MANDVLIKAVGRKKKRLKILDATAGFAHDALRMAAAGHDVTAVERDPVLLRLPARARQGAGAPSDVAKT
jgi:hypothetical protein